ncbi:unnamed protein product, partial [Closterium sp. NIES-54]
MERYGVTGGRTVMTPFPAGFKLKKAAEEDDVLEDEQRNEYQSLIGSVMNAAVHTRPDASFGVGQLARVVQRPTEEQLEVAKRLVRYLLVQPYGLHSACCPCACMRVCME